MELEQLRAELNLANHRLRRLKSCLVANALMTVLAILGFLWYMHEQIERATVEASNAAAEATHPQDEHALHAARAEREDLLTQQLLPRVGKATLEPAELAFLLECVAQAEGEEKQPPPGKPEDLDTAIKKYRQEIERDPRNAQAHNNLGIALRAKGELDAALQSFRRAIQLEPNFSQAHLNLGTVLQAKGEVLVAIQSFRRAIQLDPRNTAAHLNLGTVLQSRGEVDSAIAAYREAIRLDAKLVPAHNNLGIALAAKGDLNGAILSYRRAIALDPRYVPAYYNLGNAFKLKGLIGDAVREYRRALELDPKFAPARKSLEDLQKERGARDSGSQFQQQPSFVNLHVRQTGTQVVGCVERQLGRPCYLGATSEDAPGPTWRLWQGWCVFAGARRVAVHSGLPLDAPYENRAGHSQQV
jgi:tetratricopeptide (TPR) repeat protein